MSLHNDHFILHLLSWPSSLLASVFSTQFHIEQHVSHHISPAVHSWSVRTVCMICILFSTNCTQCQLLIQYQIVCNSSNGQCDETITIFCAKDEAKLIKYTGVCRNNKTTMKSYDLRNQIKNFFGKCLFSYKV